MLGLAALPLVSLAFMLSTHQLLQKKMPGWQVWAQPFKLTRERSHAQLRIGLLYVICTVCVISLGNWIDGGRFEALQGSPGPGGTRRRGPEGGGSGPGRRPVRPQLLLGRAGAFWWHVADFCPVLARPRPGALGRPGRAAGRSFPALWGCGAIGPPSRSTAWVGWALLLAASLLLAVLAGLLSAPGLLPLLVMPLTPAAGHGVLCRPVLHVRGQLPLRGGRGRTAPPVQT